MESLRDIITLVASVSVLVAVSSRLQCRKSVKSPGLFATHLSLYGFICLDITAIALLSSYAYMVLFEWLGYRYYGQLKNQVLAAVPVPHITLFIDVSPQQCHDRIHGRGRVREIYILGRSAGGGGGCILVHI